MERELNLEDFIPSYPYIELNKDTIPPGLKKYQDTDEISEPKLYNPYTELYEMLNFNKQEFFEDILDISEERPEQKGVPLKQQEFLARFLSPKTLNNELLLFHQVGTGKTCSAINIAELAMSMEPKLKRVLVLVKGETFEKNFINELAFQCTPGEYIPENYSKLTSKEKVFRLNANIRKKYQMSTFYKFAKSLSKISNEYIKRDYSNRVIIIDEVHNIKEMENKKEGRVYVYKQIFRFLHLIENSKVVLLSATPMKDNITEFASIMNLILPLKMQLPTKKNFNKKFFEMTDEGEKLINKDELKKYIRGRVSFLRTMESQVIKTNIGKTVNSLKYTMVDVDKMSTFQSEVYEKALRKDGQIDINELKNNSEDELLGEKSENVTEEMDEEKVDEVEKERINIRDLGEEENKEKEDKRGLYDNSRQASLFVFPNGKYGREGFNDSANFVSTFQKENIEKKGIEQKKIGKKEFSTELKQKLTRNGNYSPMDILDKIGKYSSKYKSALENIILRPKENCFVYSQFYKGSGLMVFAELLKLLGYREAEGNEDFTKQGDTQVLRFAMLAEKITNKVENNIKMFNKPENRHGKYIQVLLGSPLVSEGRSFFNVRQIHILTPHWNMSFTEQVIGRGIRAFSHKDLDDVDKYVKIYRHCSMPNRNIQSIDYLMYEISEIKDLKIKQIERICKEMAVDCALNKRRNLLESDRDYTRECEYQTCNYVCNNVPDKYIQEKLEGLFKDKNILDTYNLYYGEKLVKSTINIIQQLFKRQFNIHIKELMKHFADLSFILLIRSLKYMIQHNIPIFNKYGFICYLKYERNVFFLVDNIQSPSSYFVNYYTSHPPAYVKKQFKTIILDNQINNISKIINVINDFDLKDQDKYKYASNLIFELEPELQEQLIEYSIINKMLDPTEKNIKELTLKLFNSDIVELPEMYISTHLKNKDKYRYLYKTATSIDEWDYVDDEILTKLEYKQQEFEIQQNVENIENNPFGYYGIITKDETFKIVRILTEEEKKTQDKRTISTGQNCNTLKIKHLLDMIIKFNTSTNYFDIPNEVNLSVSNVENMKIELLDDNQIKYTPDEINNYNDNQIRIIYYWYSQGKKGKGKKGKDELTGKEIMCNAIKDFFEKNKLIKYL
jgi:superfamily II DNA or RNA helicase